MKTHELAFEIYNTCVLNVFPLPYRTKVTKMPEWQKYQTTEKTFKEIEKSEIYGVILDERHLVVDVDLYREGAKESFEEIKEFLKDCKFVVHTARDGLHHWFTKPIDEEVRKKLKELPGIDFLSKGAYVVGPGSITEDGVYVLGTWKRGGIN